MTRKQRYRIEMLVRIRDFGAAHRELFPESTMGGQGFAEVAAALDTIEHFLSYRVVARAEARKVSAALGRAVFADARTLVDAARLVTAAEAANPFRLPQSRSMVAAISTGRAFLSEAEKRQDAFIRHGISPAFFGEFRARVDQLEQAVEARLNSRTDRHQARVGLESAIATGLDAVRLLDVFVPNTLRLDPVRAAAWRGARHIDGATAASVSARRKPAVDVAEASTTSSGPAPAPGDPFVKAS
jgi:hypothetical protein